MKKRTIVATILILTLLVSALTLFACNDDEKTVSFVKTDGAKIIDEKGNAIGLYGTNLGGWLVQESWLVPTDIEKEYGQIDMMIELANRFGEDGMQELLDVYEGNWVSEIDFQRIKALGLNCVRIPFTYLNFVNAVKKVGDRYERTPYEELKVDESKFARLDWAIEMCKNTRFTPSSICTAQSVRKAETTTPATLPIPTEADFGERTKRAKYVVSKQWKYGLP